MTDGAFAPRFRITTAGVFALGFLIAFEALAVTTAMPLAVRDLHGAAFYSLTFSAFAACGVIGTVAAGAWSDRVGPTRPLIAGVTLFAIGLLIAGTAATMPALIAGRVAQGFGAGGVGVALYVLVAQAYPTRLHPQVFALLSAAWVLPSLVGPFAAGATATAFSWHWVFLGIVPLVAAATAVLAPALRATTAPQAPAAWRIRPIVWAVGAGGALLVLQPALAVPGVGPALAAAAAVAAIVALRPLLPRGTLRARRGLPAVIAVRAAFSGGMASADAYLPYSLITLRDMPPVLAGGIITVGAIAWSVGSQAQSTFGARLSGRGWVILGAGLFVTGLAGVAAVTLTTAPLVLLVVAWFLTGLGIGLAYPRLSTATLAQSTEQDRGRNSSALSIADGFGNGLALTLVGVLSTLTPAGSFLAPFGFAVAVGVLALVIAPRVPRPPTGT